MSEYVAERLARVRRELAAARIARKRSADAGSRRFWGREVEYLVARERTFENVLRRRWPDKTPWQEYEEEKERIGRDVSSAAEYEERIRCYCAEHDI